MGFLHTEYTQGGLGRGLCCLWMCFYAPLSRLVLLSPQPSNSGPHPLGGGEASFLGRLACGVSQGSGSPARAPAVSPPGDKPRWHVALCSPYTRRRVRAPLAQGLGEATEGGGGSPSLPVPGHPAPPSFIQAQVWLLPIAFCLVTLGLALLQSPHPSCGKPPLTGV